MYFKLLSCLSFVIAAYIGGTVSDLGEAILLSAVIAVLLGGCGLALDEVKA